MASSQNQAVAAAWPKVNSRYHPGRSCVSCFLCGKEQARYDHFIGLTAEVQQYIQRYSTLSIPGESCLCRNHRIEAQRNLDSSQYDKLPTWKKGIESEACCVLDTEPWRSKCIYAECSNTSGITKIIVPNDRQGFCSALGLNDDEPVALCEEHYQRVYRQMHQRCPCAGCGAKPKVREGPFRRHSPDALFVCQYLNQ